MPVKPRTPPRPVSGGFCSGSAPRFPQDPLHKTTALMPSRIRACHSDGKPPRCAYSPSCSGYDARYRCARSARLGLRNRVTVPLRAFSLRDKGNATPRPVMFPNPFFCFGFTASSPSPACFSSQGPDVVPSEDYSTGRLARQAFSVEGRETENAQQSKKKDYENKYNFRFEAQEPDRTVERTENSVAAD